MSIQFNSCMQVQSYVYTCSNKQSSNSISTGLKKFQKIFKVQLQLNKVEKISKIFQSPVQVNWVGKKFQKIFKVQLKQDLSEKISKF